VSEATVRRWIREGAPCERLGGPGRGCGTLVVCGDLKRWRAAQAGIVVDPVGPDLSAVVARGLLRAFKRGTRGATEPTWARLADRRSRASIILGDAYLSVMFELIGREPEPESLPAEIKTLQQCTV